MKKLYHLISSMKTGIVLLALIGICSALGSSWMPDAFFHFPFFKLLLLLLFINMASCTVNRIFTYIIKIRPKIINKNKSHIYYYLGLLALHAGIAIILIGGAVNAYAGKTTLVSIAEGEKINMSDLFHLEKPWAIKLNKFQIVYYEDGSPSQYNSYLSILDNHKEIKTCLISVNNPLKYGSLKIYQQSFGYLIKAEVTGNGDKNKAFTLLKEGEYINIPEKERKIKAYRYVPNFDPAYGINTKTLRPDNPRIIYSVYEKDKLLGIGVAKLREQIQVSPNYYVSFKEVQPFPILKVKSDPGLPLALTGAILVIIGILLIFIFSPAMKKNTAYSTR